MGVFYRVQRSTYDEGFAQQIDEAHQKQGWGDLEKLVHGNQAWEVKG
jgi:hypothetical protein